MDIPDDWNMEFQIEAYRITFDRAIDFAKAYPETLWCYGNHDISYPWGVLEAGYSPYAEQTVISKLYELERSLPSESQIDFIHRIDNVLFMHGGLTTTFIRSRGEHLLDADIDEVIAAVNSTPPNILWKDSSPLWLRPQNRALDIFRSDIYTQVVGHTPVQEVIDNNGVISTDVFSTYQDGRQIGESVMIVINTESGKYEKHQIDLEKYFSQYDPIWKPPTLAICKLANFTCEQLY